MRTVHVEQIDDPGNIVVRVARHLPHVADVVAYSRSSQVGLEDLVVRLPYLRNAAPLLRPPVVAIVGIDGDDLSCLWGGERGNDGRSTVVTADLDDARTQPEAACRFGQALNLGSRHPSFDIGDRRPDRRKS